MGNKLYIYQIKIKDADIKERLPFIRFIKLNRITKSCYIDLVKDFTHYDFLIDFNDSFSSLGLSTIQSSRCRPFAIEVISRMVYTLSAEHSYLRNNYTGYKSKYYSSDEFRTEMINIYGRWDYGMDMVEILIGELVKNNSWIIKN